MGPENCSSADYHGRRLRRTCSGTSLATATWSTAWWWRTASLEGPGASASSPSQTRRWWTWCCRTGLINLMAGKVIPILIKFVCLLCTSHHRNGLTKNSYTKKLKRRDLLNLYMCFYVATYSLNVSTNFNKQDDDIFHHQNCMGIEWQRGEMQICFFLLRRKVQFVRGGSSLWNCYVRLVWNGIEQYHQHVWL